MVGIVKSKHKCIANPTDVIFLGYLKDIATEQRLNLKRLMFKKPELTTRLKNIIAIVGSGMNSGKTITCRRLIRMFSGNGYRIAACKLTGSVSNRDQHEMLSASPIRA